MRSGPGAAPVRRWPAAAGRATGTATDATDPAMIRGAGTQRRQVDDMQYGRRGHERGHQHRRQTSHRYGPAPIHAASAAPPTSPPTPSNQYSTTVVEALVPAHDRKFRQAGPASRQQGLEAGHGVPEVGQHGPIEPPVIERGHEQDRHADGDHRPRKPPDGRAGQVPGEQHARREQQEFVPQQRRRHPGAARRSSRREGRPTCVATAIAATTTAKRQRRLVRDQPVEPDGRRH